MAFHIESSNFCPSGQAPRWSWWIRGVHGGNRYGVIGTDESGEGLYLYIHRGNQAPERQALLAPTEFSLAASKCRAEALQHVSRALSILGWHK